VPQQFESYEQVAQYLLDQFAGELGLKRVEAKQEVTGLRSGTTWEIDAKGVKVDGEGFVIVECRRYTTSKLKQEHLAGLAYRILDTGAEGGIVVSPMDLQEGAKKVAAAENIIEAKLTPNSTRHEYVLAFLNQIMVGLHDHIGVQESVSVEIEHADGTIERKDLA
jgi:Restriction endonuclease